MITLAIETSCDETAIAIYSDAGLLANKIYSQIDLHRVYGGVVPELASRDHVRKIMPLLDAALAEANLTKQDITQIGYTKGPGLIGALLVGASVAKALAFALGVPAIGIHHLEGHLMAVMLEAVQPSFPFLALLVSGGHSMLVAAKALGDYDILGESLDDAAGEAFDKTAKLLGLPYPGGPELAKLAEKGDVNTIRFPRPMTDRPGLDMSFSGLKTAVLTAVKSRQYRSEDIAACFQEAVVDTLLIKCQRAIDQTGYRELVVAGGVSANLRLRDGLSALEDVRVYFPDRAFCTDNAAMIAITAHQRAGQADEDLGVKPLARWPLDTLCRPA